MASADVPAAKAPGAPGAGDASVARVDKLVYVIGTFPQASQTFIAREIRGLRALGVQPLVFALARRNANLLEVPDRAWFETVRFVPRALAPPVLAANLGWLFAEPAAYLRAFRRVVGLPHRPRFLAARAVVLVMRAAWIARAIAGAGGCRQIHAHFALAQTEVAMAVSVLLNRPYSFTAHARDIYATPNALETKMRGAAHVITCTAYNVKHLRALCPDIEPARISLVHHGVDIPTGPDGANGTNTDRPRGEEPQRTRHSEDAGQPPLLLAAGRLVEKKGFGTLVAACALLRDRHVRFQCRIVGSGRLATKLAQMIREAHLTDCVELGGWIEGAQLARMMGESAIFVVPSQVTKAGDRDGIPNVILEAMGAGLPVVATPVSGIPEAVTDGVTGLLVPPDSATELAGAIERLLADPAARLAMGTAARARARNEFALDVSSRRLAGVFEN